MSQLAAQLNTLIEAFELGANERDVPTALLGRAD
jgi:hypothetical protein